LKATETVYDKQVTGLLDVKRMTTLPYFYSIYIYYTELPWNSDKGTIFLGLP